MADDIVAEEWRPIPGLPGYEASSPGRIKSCPRTTLRKDGRSLPVRGRVLALQILGKGNKQRLVVDISRNGRFYVNRLVCAAFHGEPPNPKSQSAHWDGDHFNNRSDNLRWATCKQNMEDELRHGTRGWGSKHARAKLSEQNVLDIRATWANGVAMKDIAVIFSIGADQISRICNRKVWKHV